MFRVEQHGEALRSAGRLHGFARPERRAAFGQRGFAFNFLATALWADPAETDENVGWTRELWDAMRPYTSDAAYLNYVGDEGEERVKSSYGQPNYERLVALKQKYDPRNFFRLTQNIKPG